MSSDDEQDYGSDGFQDDGSDLPSDFGEMVEEYEVDKDGNPLNAKLKTSQSEKDKKP